MRAKSLHACFWISLAAATCARAQVPPDLEAGLRKIGQIVDPGCTAKRPPDSQFDHGAPRKARLSGNPRHTLGPVCASLEQAARFGIAKNRFTQGEICHGAQ